MKYNRLSDREPFELRIEVYVLLLSRTTSLRKTEGAFSANKYTQLFYLLLWC